MSEQSVERVDQFIADVKFNLKALLSTASFLIVGLGAIGIYFIGSTISDIRSEMKENAETYVEKAIVQEARNVENIVAIANDLRSSKEDYDEYREAISALQSIKNMNATAEVDPQGIYEKMKSLEEKGEDSSLSDADRLASVELGDLAVRSAASGIADPDLSFNLAVVSARLGLRNHATQLAVITSHWKSSTTHRILKAEYEDIYGISYTFSDGNLEKSTLDAMTVRHNAWNIIIEIIESSPRLESEQAYSRAMNVAVRNRTAGYLDQIIQSIEKSVSSGKNLTSYAYLSLARAHAMLGYDDWEGKTWAAIEQAVLRLQSESPMASWYDHSRDDLLKLAVRLGEVERVMSIFQQHNIE